MTDLQMVRNSSTGSLVPAWLGCWWLLLGLMSSLVLADAPSPMFRGTGPFGSTDGYSPDLIDETASQEVALSAEQLKPYSPLFYYDGLLRHHKVRPDDNVHVADLRLKPVMIHFDQPWHIYEMLRGLYRGYNEQPQGWSISVRDVATGLDRNVTVKP